MLCMMLSGSMKLMGSPNSVYNLIIEIAIISWGDDQLD